MVTLVALTCFAFAPKILEPPLWPVAVSGDGRFVLGAKLHRPGEQTGMLWEWRTGKMMKLPTPPGCTYIQPTDISDNGNVVVGYAYQKETQLVCVWRNAGPPKVISNDAQGNPVVSGDGKSVFFTRESKWSAYKWTEKEGLQPMGFIRRGKAPCAHVSDSSFDGQVIVGACNVEEKYPHEPHSGLCQKDATGTATYWKSIEQPVEIGRPGDVIATVSYCCSADGKIITGSGPFEKVGDRPFIWSEKGGYRLLEVPKGALSVTPSAITADGRCIFGVQQTSSGQIALVWVNEGEPRTLPSEVKRAGVPLGRWKLESFKAMSNDGTVIVGSDPDGVNAIPWMLVWKPSWLQ